MRLRLWDRKKPELQRTKDGNAQFSLCCTSTAMPDDESRDRHPAFCFSFGHFQRSRGISNCPNFATDVYATRNLVRENRTWRSSFLSVVQVHPRLNVVTIAKTRFLLRLG